MMARPQQDAIETFMSITGASEAAAVEKLQAHAGDLNEAVNAYFNEGEHVLTRPERDQGPHPDWMEENEPAEMEVDTFPSIGAHFPPYGPINRGLMNSPIFDGRSTSHMPSRNSIPYVSYPRNVRNIPIESKDEEGQVGDENATPAIEEVSASVHAQGPEVRGTVIFDDDDELPSTASSTFRAGSISRGGYNSNSYPHGRELRPSAPQVTEEPIAAIEEGSAIEEEMLQAAIEASKREAEEANMRQQHGLISDQLVSGVDHHQITPISDDDEFARAVSLSIKTAQQEKALRELEGVAGSGEQNEDFVNLLERARPNMGRRQGSSSSKIGTSSQEKMDVDDAHRQLDVISVPDETEEPEEQPLLRRRSIRRAVSGTAETATHIGQDLDSPPSSSGPHSITGAPQHNGDPFHEWGGISSQEHDEAVMLEAALFGGIPEHIGVTEPYRRRNPQPPSPTLEAERLLREQQDDEYLASLQADREKAEAQRMEEEAAREAAAAEQKRQQEEAHRRLQEEEESERKLAAKKASLPPEPSVEDENAVTLLVRMPDGSRRGRRFLKSDRLQSLFDFIDIGGGVKPGTYRLVRQYPRRAFTDGEHGSSLSDLGLTSKQEALFLELI